MKSKVIDRVRGSEIGRYIGGGGSQENGGVWRRSERGAGVHRHMFLLCCNGERVVV